MQLLSPGDEDLAQLYHQVLASLAEESPSGEQSAHAAMPLSADRELESFYGQYHDGEGTPTATRLQPSARSQATWRARARTMGGMQEMRRRLHQPGLGRQRFNHGRPTPSLFARRNHGQAAQVRLC